MVAFKTLAAASLVVFPTASLAERFFCNSGTRDGWDYVREEHNGRVQEVTNVAYGEPSALKMTQTYDEGYSGRYHSEVDVNDGYQRGHERFYGFAFRLSGEWEFGTQRYNIAQFIANRPGAGCGGDDWMPSTMVWMNGDQLATRIVSGEYRQPDCGRDIDNIKDLGKVDAGVWHRIVIQSKWESSGSGLFKVWFDGDVVVNRTDLATTVNDDEQFQFRVGRMPTAGMMMGIWRAASRSVMSGMMRLPLVPRMRMSARSSRCRMAGEGVR